MRRAVLVLSVIAVAVLMLPAVSCQRENSLRIIRLEPKGPLFSDIVDWGTFTDPTDPEAEPEWISSTPTDYVTLELQYVEMGLGLPTWTPYQAHITRVAVTYNAPTGTPPEEWEGSQTVYSTNIVVSADPEGRNTTEADILLIPAAWKEQHFDAGDPEEYGPEGIVIANVQLDGIDDVSKKTIRATNAITVEIGNWWDELSRLGQ